MSGFLRKIAAAAAIFTLSLPAGAQTAQQLAEPGGSQIRLGDAWTQFPYPSWQKTNNTLAETSIMRQQHGDTLIVAMIPAFLGLPIILPLLGHASWHLYRSAIK